MASSPNAGVGGSSPDLMNDPAFDTNTGTGETGGDLETCRICRSEATQDEQLFHPCKCSGSIKFVHQECLMEWLSHSQKKHCELCKTPFRFTKLYSPEMPQSLPNIVFARHLITQTFSSTLTWSRFLLVSFVWLGWLPWSMRAVWRFLFWFADGAWILTRGLERSMTPAESALAITKERMAEMSQLFPNPSAIARSPKTSSTISAARTSSMPLLSISGPVSQTLNFSTGEPMLVSLFKKLLRLDNGPQTPSQNLTQNSNNSLSQLDQFGPTTSVLSQVKFFNEMTRYPTLNKILIDTIEGQMITLLVVVAFILIFLIREWVVQQQPGLNVAGDFNADLAGEQRDAPEWVDEIIDVADPEGTDEPEAGNEEFAQADEGLGAAVAPGRIRPLARARRRVHFPPPDQQRDDRPSTNDALMNDLPTTESPSNPAVGTGELPGGLSPSPTIPQRPGLPSRETLSKVAEIRRSIEESNRYREQGWPKLNDFAETWYGADGEPSEALQLVDEAGHTDKLTRIVAIMNRLQEEKGKGNHDRVAEIRASLADSIMDSDGLSHKLDMETLERLFGVLETATDLDELGTFGKNHHGKGKAKSLETTPDDSTGPPTDAQSSDLGGSFNGDGQESSAGDAAEGDSAQEISTTGLTLQVEDDKRDPTWQTGPWDTTISHSELLTRLGRERSRAEVSDTSSGFGTPLLERAFNGDRSEDEVQGASSGFGTPLLGRFDYPRPHGDESIEVSHPTQSDDRVLGENQAQLVDTDAIGESDDTETHSAPKRLIDRLMDWLWGGVASDTLPRQVPHQNDEHVVQNLDEEAPFVPVNHEAHIEPHFGGDENVEHNHMAEDPAVAPELDPEDPEAFEDGEEFDGVMELIGMRGPLAGLFQNAMFSAILVSLTLGMGIWFPCVWGKVVFAVSGNHFVLFVKAPLRFLSAAANLIVDLAFFFIGSFIYWSDQLVRIAFRPLAPANQFFAKFTHNLVIANATKSVAESGLDRIAKLAVKTSITFKENDIPIFSITSHQVLQSIKASIYTSCSAVIHVIASMPRGNASPTYFFDITSSPAAMLKVLGKGTAAHVASVFSLTFFSIFHDAEVKHLPIDPALAHWDAWDRTIAIIVGYVFFSVIGALYLTRGRPFTSSDWGKRFELFALDSLQQAGGVLKVVLIISIEMIVFPLYCGLLLDVALLPLFERASFESRVHFTLHAPWTSIFVHWFVGTCYMFHFALFVSMCRKIMRRGVLYFIRDPDDPTFHPVRDVLERNVATQLRKIAFSALVYGALVVICLGGVVWGLSYAFDGVLPIHWSSNEPVLEFPVDLLFYNFFMPLAVKFLRPTEGLQRMYTWCFKKCARSLRLSWFLFGERREDEEGRHVRKSWNGVLSGTKGDPMKPVIGNDRKRLFEDGNVKAYFIRDGRYVRTPASDQVRIPKGGQTFIEVNEHNERVDGQDTPDDGQHGPDSDQYARVYVPPWFRVRVGLFIFLIWIFAAMTGVGITVVPLVFGRWIFASIIPSHHRMNDVYAFSIGIYAFGGFLYGALNYDRGLFWIRRTFHLDYANGRRSLPHVESFSQKAFIQAMRMSRLIYMYTAFGVVLPSLCALLMEFYVIIPMHTYLAAPGESHIIHFIQDWTLGVLYVKMAGRLILWYAQSRPAQALRAVNRNGWLNPDIHLATRGFILPACIVMGTALLGPLPLGWVANKLLFADGASAVQSKVYRYAYPGVLGVCFAAGMLYLLSVLLTRWRMAIRDEVYLIGERLHNFGERRASSAAVGAAVAASGARVRA